MYKYKNISRKLNMPHYLDFFLKNCIELNFIFYCCNYKIGIYSKNSWFETMKKSKYYSKNILVKL